MAFQVFNNVTAMLRWTTFSTVIYLSPEFTSYDRPSEDTWLSITPKVPRRHVQHLWAC